MWRGRERCYSGNFSRLCVPHNERTPGQILGPIQSKSTLIMTRCNEINLGSFHRDFVYCLMQNWKPFRAGAAEKHYSRLSYSQGPFSVEWKVNKPPLLPLPTPAPSQWRSEVRRRTFPVSSLSWVLEIRDSNCVSRRKTSEDVYVYESFRFVCTVCTD